MTDFVIMDLVKQKTAVFCFTSFEDPNFQFFVIFKSFKSLVWFIYDHNMSRYEHLCVRKVTFFINTKKTNFFKNGIFEPKKSIFSIFPTMSSDIVKFHVLRRRNLNMSHKIYFYIFSESMETDLSVSVSTV